LREKVARDSGSDEGLNILSACLLIRPMTRRDPSSVSLRLTPSPTRGEGTLYCGIRP